MSTKELLREAIHKARHREDGSETSCAELARAVLAATRDDLCPDCGHHLHRPNPGQCPWRGCQCAVLPEIDDPEVPQTYDEAVQRVHRAFCYPDELVGEWDRMMAEALHRNGYRIIKAEATPATKGLRIGTRDEEGRLILSAGLLGCYGGQPHRCSRCGVDIAAALAPTTEIQERPKLRLPDDAYEATPAEHPRTYSLVGTPHLFLVTDDESGINIGYAKMIGGPLVAPPLNRYEVRRNK